MFVLKQFLKALILPPLPWMLMLLAVLIFWRRRWARKLLFVTFCLIVVLHSGIFGYFLRYPLESRYPPLIDPTKVEPYDAIVVLTGGMIPAEGLIPFPSIDRSMFRRLEEAWRLYHIRPKPIVVSGGHVNPFTPPKDENRIARDYLIRWGVPKSDVLGEGQLARHLRERRRSGKTPPAERLETLFISHLGRSHAAKHARFQSQSTGSHPSAGDFSLGKFELEPFHFFPGESAARDVLASLHEYVGLVNYYWRVHFGKDS